MDRRERKGNCVCPFMILLMVRVFANGPGAWVQPQVMSYQRLKKWYLMPPCLTLSIRSRVKWSNPGKRVARAPLHLGVVAIKKGA